MPLSFPTSNVQSFAASSVLRSFFWFVILVNLIATCQAKQIVLIHYANETSPTGKDAENHRVTIERLEQIEHETAKDIANNLRDEPHLLSEAILADRTDLREHLPSRLDVVLCEVDNAGVRQGIYRYWLPGDSTPRKGNVVVEEVGDYVLDGNPLATAKGLRAALTAIASRFPPAKHKFILITESHGSNELALTVKLARKHEDISFDEFRKLFDGESVTYSLPKIGVTKLEYFNILEQLGTELGMHFPLVVLQSCKGVFEWDLARELPINIDLFFASGHRYLEYRSMPYSAVLETSTSASDLVDSFDRQMTSDFLRIEHVSPSWSGWIWTAPLLAVLLTQWLRRWFPGKTECVNNFETTYFRN